MGILGKYSMHLIVSCNSESKHFVITQQGQIYMLQVFALVCCLWMISLNTVTDSTVKATNNIIDGKKVS